MFIWGWLNYDLLPGHRSLEGLKDIFWTSYDVWLYIGGSNGSKWKAKSFHVRNFMKFENYDYIFDGWLIWLTQ